MSMRVSKTTIRFRDIRKCISSHTQTFNFTPLSKYCYFWSDPQDTLYEQCCDFEMALNHLRKCYNNLSYVQQLLTTMIVKINKKVTQYNDTGSSN